MAILAVLTRKLDLADETDLEKLAEATEWFSGADLQSLLYSAQVSTIEGLLDNEQVCIANLMFIFPRVSQFYKQNMV